MKSKFLYPRISFTWILNNINNIVLYADIFFSFLKLNFIPLSKKKKKQTNVRRHRLSQSIFLVSFSVLTITVLYTHVWDRPTTQWNGRRPGARSTGGATTGAPIAGSRQRDDSFSEKQCKKKKKTNNAHETEPDDCACR